MKKIVSLIISFILIFACCISVSAAGESASCSGNTSVTAGQNITLTFSLSGYGDVTSGGVTISHGSEFEIVSGSWLKTGFLTDFNVGNKQGAVGFTGPTNINGNIFQVVLKAKTASASAKSVSATFTMKNGATSLPQTTATKSIQIGCATHSYSGWTNNNATNHIHTCSACGKSETQNHTWNGGEVTKQADCKEAGEKKFTCTTCNATKTEPIAKTNNHKFSSWSETKGATCTTAGTQTRTCSVCSKTETSTINAKGHSFGAWSQTSAPSCTTQGQQKRTCTRNGCSHSETKAVAALGHAFSKATVTKQPTCTESGVETGTCTRCSQKTTNAIRPTGHKYGGWKDVTAATCTAQGQQERACSKCAHKETRATAVLGHDFENPTLIKEATLTSTGLMEGKCKRCNEATQEVIPCKAEDTTTGITIEAGEGVFAEGTTTNFTVITKDDGNYESVKNAVADKGSKFVAYNIQYMLNGAVASATGEYTLLLPNADKVDADNMLVLYIAEDGTVTEKEFTINEDDKIAVKTTESGTYVVVDKSTAEEVQDEDVKTDGKVDEKEETNTTPWVVIVIVAVVLIAGVVVAIVLGKKKKEQADVDLAN